MPEPVFKEDHLVTDFKIFPEPKGFSEGILRKIRTVLNKTEKLAVAEDGTHKRYLLFTVIVNATNNFKGKPLSKIQVTSTYLIEYNITNRVQIDMACDLVERSIFNCYNSYIDKVSGTYLKNDT